MTLPPGNIPEATTEPVATLTRASESLLERWYPTGNPLERPDREEMSQLVEWLRLIEAEAAARQARPPAPGSTGPMFTPTANTDLKPITFCETCGRAYPKAPGSTGDAPADHAVIRRVLTDREWAKAQDHRFWVRHVGLLVDDLDKARSAVATLGGANVEAEDALTAAYAAIRDLADHTNTRIPHRVNPMCQSLGPWESGHYMDRSGMGYRCTCDADRLNAQVAAVIQAARAAAQPGRAGS